MKTRCLQNTDVLYAAHIYLTICNVSVSSKIEPPTIAATGWAAGFSATNVLDPFTVDVSAAPGWITATDPNFKMSYEACTTPEGDVTFPGSGAPIALGATVTLTNPASAYASETWCVLVTLYLPEAGVDTAIAALEFTVTATVTADGDAQVSSSSTSLELGDLNDQADESGAANGGAVVAFDPFDGAPVGSVTATITPDPILFGSE